MKKPWIVLGFAVLASSVAGQDLKVTGIQAQHRNGQTFVTWKDVAEGEDNAKYRYSLYRAEKPITQETLAKAELCMESIFNNSARLFGTAFRQTARLKADGPTATLKEGAKPQPAWSGVAVVTIPTDRKSCYAVVAMDETRKPVTTVVPGESATKEVVDEKVAPIQPIKLHDSKTYGRYARVVQVTGATNLPLHVGLHASNAQGGGAGDHGDYWLYYSPKEWGYREGMPGVFSMTERVDDKTKKRRLLLRNRDTIVVPNGNSPMETYWFGYVCVPEWSEDKTPLAYPFTERRVDWIVKWCIEKYKADPNRVYCDGGSMGAWGTMAYALRRPDMFAAIYPNRPRTIQKGMPSLVKIQDKNSVMMEDEKMSYFDRMNAVKYATEHHEDLPFLGWCCGRRDGFASWKEQIQMVEAMTKSHHGFAFAWNDGDHSSGSRPMGQVTKYYAQTKFARNESYPAFGNSSINQNMGNGDPKDGDMEGGINLGFAWKDLVDEVGKWTVTLSNELAKEDMTVDVTPRRCQLFKPKAGDKFTWTHSAGGAGEVVADPWGLVTVGKVIIKPGAETTLTITGK